MGSENDESKPVEKDSLEPLPDSRPSLPYVLFAVVVAAVGYYLALVGVNWLFGNERHPRWGSWDEFFGPAELAKWGGKR